MATNNLTVSEVFYSFQGEGRTAGAPAVFLRLAGCNLLCGSNDGTWTCDTIDIWRKGTNYAVDALVRYMREKGHLEQLAKGAHLVITGGEPLLQQCGMAELINVIRYVVLDSCYVEIETNATILPSTSLLYNVDQWNCSPKLSSSGNKEKDRYDKEALFQFASEPNATFKFVINSKADVDEVISDFFQIYPIAPNRIWLMPQGATREELFENQEMVAKAAMKHYFNYSSRGQVVIWSGQQGV